MTASKLVRWACCAKAGSLYFRNVYMRTRQSRGLTSSARNQNAVSPGLTPVEKAVRDSIKTTGPMSVSTYMQLCLSHPTHGYYMNPANPVFGKAGDFITSPEISQVFGELIAIWHLSRWLAAGKPPRIRVIELGPGRGTLAADALRTWAQFPTACSALRNGGGLHLVETSDAMRKLQEETLRRSGVLEKIGVGGGGDGEFVKWYSALEDVRNPEEMVNEDTFTIVVAHEFFDALPVHVLEKAQDGWHEIQITYASDPASKTVLNSSHTSQPNVPPLRLIRNPEPTTLSTFLGSLSPRYAALPIGSRLEVSPSSFKLVHTLAEILNDPRGAGGSALVFDYGRDGISGNSLRAFRKHKIVDIFETPGECDLTANVDFALLKEGTSDAATAHGPITQRDFLTGMGIDTRVSMLQAAKNAESDHPDAVGKGIEAIAQAARRLVDPTGMGVQYKVLGITAAGGRKMREEEKVVWPFTVPDLERSKSGDKKPDTATPQ